MLKDVRVLEALFRHTHGTCLTHPYTVAESSTAKLESVDEAIRVARHAHDE